MTDLDKAREWAERWSEDDPLILADAKAAIKLIKALPDQWVSVEKVLEAISGQLSVYTRGTVSHYIAEEITRKLKEALITPKLPTLADMTAEERKACQWMQCKVETDDEDVIGVIRRVWPKSADVIFQSGRSIDPEHRRVTPLPDLPKLEWPGGVVDCEIVDEPETVDAPPAEKAALPKPEDVPANEPWLIEVADGKAIGTRFAGDAFAPWSVASLDGSFAGDYGDNGITLIHKLVPETHALPKGMRLADHEEYGRVVVAPHANTHGEEYFYRLIEDNPWGASHGYRQTEEFTFLDGDQRA